MGTKDASHCGIKVGKLVNSLVLSKRSPAMLAQQISKQLDSVEPPGGVIDGVDKTSSMEHSSDDDVAFLAEFQPVRGSKEQHEVRVLAADQ
ncbi:hypothetical protein V6N11_044281 [Hibiscus sabdariffa]|uniref:Uncharacterized protein n=1 Tax=Hibiscus sabdariffa TaxID=183260 RepID=A0ABR2REQ2_9ROSI